MTIELAGESLVLLPEKAAHWPAEKMLIVADLHVGKCATLRTSGIAVPETGTGDLEIVREVVSRYGIERLMILGDFFHAADGRTRQVHDAISEWRASLPDLAIDLVLGNHDRSSGRPLAEWRFEVHPRPHAVGPFVFRHEPVASDYGYVLAGHIHPAIRVSAGRKSSLRMPCFLFEKTHGVLPAMGGLTGTHVVEPGEDARVYAVADRAVVEIPGQLLSR